MVFRAICFFFFFLEVTQVVSYTIFSIKKIHNYLISFYLLWCFFLQGILKGEDDINMLGEEFRLAYQKRRGNPSSEES